MTAPTTPQGSSSGIAWILGGIALLGFALLMVFAINNSSDTGSDTTTTTTVPDGEVTPPEDESGTDGEG